MRVLAFDYGASSGRAILFTFDGKKLSAEEVYRFENVPVREGGFLRWDYDLLRGALVSGLREAAIRGPLDAVGIDTWGVDFGLLGEDGTLLEYPVHYRDEAVSNIPDEVFSLIPRERLYSITGIQTLPFNTIFRLYHLKKYRPEVYARTKKFLFMPDLLAYELTGRVAAERTVASTSQLIDAATGEWSGEIISALGLDRNIFPPIAETGGVYGYIRPGIADESGLGRVPVIAVCGHDTASAVLSVPATGSPLYISCGTWSLLGTVLERPLLTAESERANFTNETGYGGTIRYLKNIMGLWLINECRRSLSREREVSFDELAREAAGATRRFIIDPDDPAFLAPDDMVAAIGAYCRERYGDEPRSAGEIAACVYGSLCESYRGHIATLERLTGRRFGEIFVVGGGCNAAALMQSIADVCGLTVHAGPTEATAIGNALAQLVSLGALKAGDGLKALVSDCFEVKTYRPRAAKN